MPQSNVNKILYITYGRDDPDDTWTPLAAFYDKTAAINSDDGGWRLFRVTKTKVQSEEIIAEPLS